MCRRHPRKGIEMNRDDIIRMAREAGGRQAKSHELYDYLLMSTDALERFFLLAAAAGATAEREACAKACEETTASWTQHLYNEGVMDCVKAIRARGEK